MSAYEYLEILARAELEHAASCPYCHLDKMAELHAQAEDVPARPRRAEQRQRVPVPMDRKAA